MKVKIPMKLERFKDTTHVNDVLHCAIERCIFNKGYRVCIVTANRMTAKEVYEIVANYMLGLDTIYATFNSYDLRIKFHNGSYIVFKSNIRSVRGYAFNYMVVDHDVDAESLNMHYAPLLRDYYDSL